MLETLKSVVDAASVSKDYDAFTLHDVKPGAVIEPRSADEAATIMKLACEREWRVECAGGGTQMYGNRRTRADIVLSTRGMHNVVEYEPADLVIGVQAGMRLRSLQRETRRHAQFLALDPVAHRRSTAGGMIATARSGPLRYAHGTPRDHVLGLQMVTGDGRILQLGGRVVKNVAGYDLVRLLVGSAGTLGLITSAYVRLKPIPQSEQTMLISAGEPQPLLELAGFIRETNLEAAAMELLAAGTLTESWALLVRLAGSQEGVADAQQRIKARSVPLNASAQPVPEAEWGTLQRIELEAETIVRLADLPARIDTTLQLAHKVISKLSAPCHLAAHAGDGIVRVLIGESAIDETAFAIGEARSVMNVSGGTVLVQSRNGELMRRVDAFGTTGALLPLMAKLKKIFDPAGILAPGRFVV
jgi:glycolate oxidase FAD binding subunit